jgi:hypothetical protein
MVFTLTDFDKAKAKGKKNCSKGLACGAGCISKTKKCKQKMGAGGGAYADHIGDPANLEKGAESSEVASESTQGETQKANVQIRESDLTNKRSAFVEQYGEDLVSKAESNIQKIIDDNDVLIRVSSEKIDLILQEGKLLNSGELLERKSNPDFGSQEYQGRRNEYEEKAMGIPLDTPSSERPIYAYAGNTSNFSDPHHEEAESYGNVAFKLKPEVKERASVSSTDTFVSGLSSKASNFNAGSLEDGDGNANKYLNGAAQSKTIDEYVQKTGSSYLEYQIQGGVKTTDIAEIHFTLGNQPSESTVKWAKENGVKIFKT